MLSKTPWIVGLALAGAVSLASGQPQQGGSSSDELLAELRGLRAELRQAADASMRGQLLVARLQLQEQRILTAGRQLGEVEDKLATVKLLRGTFAQQLKQFDESRDPISPQQRAEMEPIKMLRAQLDQQDKAAQELQAREAALQRTLADEQARWTDFNERLDELERALPARRPR